MRKIALFNQKGGVGKTTIATNLAGIFSTVLKKRVLVIDCDAQANTTDYLSATMDELYEYSLEDLISDFFDPTDLDKVKTYIFPTEIIKKSKTIKTGIDLIPVTDRFDEMEISDINVLNEKLKSLENEYDYCFIDCPPQKTQGTMIALAFADYVLVPMLADIDSAKGYGMILNLVDELKRNGINETLEILGIVINAYRNYNVYEYVSKNLQESMGEVVFDTKLRETIVVRNARIEGLLLTQYGYEAKDILEDYKMLSKEIIGRINGFERKVGR